MRSYEAARGLFSFLGFCSWAVIVLGGIIALVGGAAVGSGFGQDPSGAQAIMQALPGIAMSLLGVYGLALVQMGRAGVDSAKHGQQALQVARDHLEVSRQLIAQTHASPTSYKQATASMPPLSESKTANDPET